MPSIAGLKSLTTAVKIELNPEFTITLNCRLECIGGSDSEYQKLATAGMEILTERARLAAQLQDGLTAVQSLKAPPEASFVTFRNTVQQHIGRLATNIGDSPADLQGDNWRQMQQAILDTSTALEAFDQLIVPDAAEIEARTAEFEKQIKQVEKEIDKIDKRSHKNRAQRLKYIIESWDLTDGEGDEAQPWLVSVENIESMNPQLVAAMLNQVEETVGGFFTKTRRGTGNL